MAKYKGIGGTTVGFRSSSASTTYPSGFEGSIYYNSSNAQFEFVGPGGGAWSSGGNLNTARYLTSGDGPLTTNLVFGGYTSDETAVTESYNGTSWTETGDLNSARRTCGAVGNSSACLGVGGNPGDNSPTGYNTANVESFNGSSWTEIANINTARQSGKAVGTTTAAIFYGGYTTGDVANNESWDGSSWTEIGDLNVSRASCSGAGTSTAAIAMSGGPNANIGTEAFDTESWNGSSWTALPASSNINIKGEGAHSCGTQTAALLYGGYDYSPPAGNTARTESWNGSTWTELADLSTARNTGGDGGTSSIAILAGGSTPPGSGVNTTEEWSLDHTLKTVTTS